MSVPSISGTPCGFQASSVRLLTIALIALIVAAPTTAQQLVREEPGTRFVAVDVFIDPLGRGLAAYQIEIVDTSGASRLVGVEGGEHSAYSEPPFYDAAALQEERVILAAFSIDDALPSTLTRVATLHVLIEQGRTPDWRLRLEVAATADGSEIPVKLEWKGDRS